MENRHRKRPAAIPALGPAQRAGRRLLALRDRRGLSLAAAVAAFKERFGVNLDASNLARYERGEGETALARYEQLAQFYGVTLADLFKAARSRRPGNHSARP